MEAIEINEFTELKSGENLFQSASIAPIEGGLDYEIISDNDLEYIDYLNLSKVVEVMAEFFDVSAVAISKDSKLYSVALGSSSQNAYDKAIDCDPLAVCNGTIGFTQNVDTELAKQLKAMQVKNVVAMKFEDEAIKILKRIPDINIIQINTPLQELLGFQAKEIKRTPFGYLIQDPNFSKLSKSSFKVAGKMKPNQRQAEDAIFAWKICKYVPSNSAIIAKDLSTKAIAQYRANCSDATEAALDFACESSKDAVLAVDGVIESEETIFAAIQGRIGLVIEAGDGFNSENIVKVAEKYKIVIIKTGIRNNKY